MYFIQSQLEHSQNDTNKRSQQTEARLEPAIRNAQNVFQPWRPTLTSRSLQSIARPFQKRFRKVFGNARILIFYLSIKAWEEKSLPKSHLRWFFLVVGEGKATKENISIVWFIWPLNPLYFSNPLTTSSSAMGLSSTTINYTAGNKTDNQWLNGAATSFVNLTLLLSFQLV